MTQTVWVLGVHMTPFGRYPESDLVDLGATAARAALADASVSMADVGVLAAGSVYEAGDNVGQRVQKQIGQTGIPVFNVANACATGATAFRVAHQAIAAGEADVALALGVEKMGKMGLIGGPSKGRSKPTGFEPRGRFGAVVPTEGVLGTGLMPGVFAQASMAHVRAHDGIGFEQFARVAEKNHAHSVLNPLAQYRTRFTLDEIRTAEMISYPNTLLMCCPTGDGAASAVLVGEERLRGLSPEQRARAVKVSASVLTTDPWMPGCQVLPDVNTLTQQAADRAYETAGVGPEDLDLVELHDCFASAELLHYENLRLCEPGGGGDFIDSRAPWRDGRTPVNVSGGLLSKGHPLGATGLANIFEVVTHLRGEAGDRQIEGARVGLTHVLGLGSACAVHVLERPAA